MTNLAALVIELPKGGLKRKAEVLNKLHENRILYKIEGRYLVIEGFKLEIVEENDKRELFVKYDINMDRERLIKWVYVKRDEPNLYYRIRAIHCASNKIYMKALKRRKIPLKFLKMASETLKDKDIVI
ncbi:MAG: hypothetical protein N3E39_00910 [Candidatus Methanomethylicia archaeon]|nr:hypothetical protein [Candidatus Methanomethylicia archaeon]MDW7988507.1 hypothetical protein [Nitrososphaerota archaeon]